MKRILLILLFLFAGKALWAQSNPPICGIYYDYNALGQRIKRSYDCRAPNSGSGPVFPPGYQARSAPPENGEVNETKSLSSKIQVYPNPTSGPYTIALSEAPKEPVHFHWYSERGQILGSGTITDQKATGDISVWADGMYLLQVYIPAGTESFRVVKVTSAR